MRCLISASILCQACAAAETLPTIITSFHFNFYIAGLQCHHVINRMNITCNSTRKISIAFTISDLIFEMGHFPTK